MATEQSLSAVKKAYLDVAFGQIHYRYSLPATGSAHAPIPILLLHMSASSSSCFQDLMSALSSRGHICYAPDMPGFGASDHPMIDPPDIAWYAELYHAAFSKLPEFMHGCHILGHHSGAIIGTELGNREKYGAFVRSLTCVGPAVLSAEQRSEMSKTFLDPFNKPVASGDHLIKTWEYLQWEGLSPDTNLDLLHREALDHIRAWKGRSQIYSCVWAFDCKKALELVPPECKVLGLCARDDVLWPFFEQFKVVSKEFTGKEIAGGNFGPDRDCAGILRFFVPFICAI